MMHLCLDKRVVAGLAVVAVVVFAVNPSWLAPALPVLLLAICPLSMLAMMARHRDDTTPATPDAGVDTELEALRAEVASLRQAIPTTPDTSPDHSSS